MLNMIKIRKEKKKKDIFLSFRIKFKIKIMGKRLAVLRWYGGKFYMLKHILPLLSQCNHKCYVEVFGGAGHVLFNKEPSPVEIYNDIDEDLVNFFRVIRDEEKFKVFREKIELIPYSRVEFEFYKSFEPKDDVDRAIKFFVLVRQSFSSNMGTWSYGIKKNQAKAYFNAIQDLDRLKQRIRNVQIECKDFRDVLKRYDSEETLFYCDPPYVLRTRREKKSYRYEMTDEDHRDLVEMLLRVKGKVMLSGYRNEIYEVLEKAGWERRDYEVYLCADNQRLRGERDKRVESLWLSPNFF